MGVSKTLLRGFAGLPPMWRRCHVEAFRKAFPRSDEPWQLADDRRLLRAYERDRDELDTLPKGERYQWWMRLAEPFGRTKEAVQQKADADGVPRDLFELVLSSQWRGGALPCAAPDRCGAIS